MYIYTQRYGLYMHISIYGMSISLSLYIYIYIIHWPEESRRSMSPSLILSAALRHTAMLVHERTSKHVVCCVWYTINVCL